MPIDDPFSDFLEEMADETPPEPPGHTGQSPKRREPPPPDLVRASDLVTDPETLDQGDYEPGPDGTLYKGFLILDKKDWPADHEAIHGNQTRRFYVRSPTGLRGMVPWDGAQVIWPWEQAWKQDLYRPEVTSLLKEEKKKK